jgi:hypothetical protein
MEGGQPGPMISAIAPLANFQAKSVKQENG